MSIIISFIRRHMWTATLVLLAGVFMMLGLGSRIMNVYEGLAKTDRLAALTLVLSGVPDNALPITLLDVDDSTRRSWKSEGATPQAALAELIRIAASGGAKGILLDFDLSADAPGASGDVAMMELLGTYAGEAPLLMLVRRISFSRNSSVSETGERFIASAPATPFDAIVANKPNIIWVTTLNQIGADRAVRHIRLWQTVCEGASGVTFPSAALATAAYLIDGIHHGDDLQTFMARRVEAICAGRKTAVQKWPPLQQQVAQLPYVFSDNAGSPARLRIKVDGKGTVVLRRISAERLVSFEGGRAASLNDVDSDAFSGRVVIIGGSYTDSRDLHVTPLGTMPGSVILANSIVQARRLVETVPATPFLRGVLAFGLFLIFAAFVRYFVGVAALVVIFVASLAALILLSRVFGFESGFEAVAVAIGGFALYRLVDAVWLILRDVPKRGWRAIMKP